MVFGTNINVWIICSNKSFTCHNLKVNHNCNAMKSMKYYEWNERILIEDRISDKEYQGKIKINERKEKMTFNDIDSVISLSTVTKWEKKIIRWKNHEKKVLIWDKELQRIKSMDDELVEWFKWSADQTVQLIPFVQITSKWHINSIAGHWTSQV